VQRGLKYDKMRLLEPIELYSEWLMYLVHRVLDAISTQHLAKVLRLKAKFLGLAVRKGIIVIRNLGLGRGELVDIKLSLLKQQ